MTPISWFFKKEPLSWDFFLHLFFFYSYFFQLCVSDNIQFDKWLVAKAAQDNWQCKPHFPKLLLVYVA